MVVYNGENIAYRAKGVGTKRGTLFTPSTKTWTVLCFRLASSWLCFSFLWSPEKSFLWLNVFLINAVNFTPISRIWYRNFSVCSVRYCFWQPVCEGYPFVSTWLYRGIFPSSFAGFRARCHYVPAGTPLETRKCHITPWQSSKHVTFTQVFKCQLRGWFAIFKRYILYC